MKKINFPVVADDFLPNKEPSILIDTVEDASPDGVICKMVVGSRKSVSYTEDQELPVVALLEVMTQAMSVWNTLFGPRGNKKNRFGILVNISRFIITRNGDLPKGMELKITANIERVERNYVHCVCYVRDVLENEVIAQVNLEGVIPTESQVNDLLHQSELSRL